MRLRKFLNRLRLRPLEGEGERPEDNVDAGDSAAAWDAIGPDSDRRPPTWMPSQQDERPRY